MTLISHTTDPENSRNILFTYIPRDINDNLSPFAGPFRAKKREQDTLRKSRRKVVATKSVKRLTHLYSYPDPARAPLSNFTAAPLKCRLTRV